MTLKANRNLGKLLVVFTAIAATSTFVAAENKKVQPNACTLSCASVPTGTVMPFAGTAAPTGYLLADGSEVSRSTFASLYAVVGDAYGTPADSANFILPDLRGRVAAGKDDMGGTAAGRISGASGVAGSTLGAAGGEEMHTLSVGEMPSHNHSDTGHNHRQGVQGGIVENNFVSINSNSNGNASGSQAGVALTNILTATAYANISYSGGNAAHNVLQPTVILNYIVKY